MTASPWDSGLVQVQCPGSLCTSVCVAADTLFSSFLVSLTCLTFRKSPQGRLGNITFVHKRHILGILNVRTLFNNFGRMQNFLFSLIMCWMIFVWRTFSCCCWRFTVSLQPVWGFPSWCTSGLCCVHTDRQILDQQGLLLFFLFLSV